MVATDPYDDYREELLTAGLLVKTGVKGLYGRSGAYEAVVSGLNRLIEEAGRDESPEPFAFPPLIARRTYELTDHIRSFPDLMGSIHGFAGGDQEHRALLDAFEHGDDWGAHLTSTDLMLCPAACYPLYPMLEGQTVAATGRVFDVVGFCYRHEPSPDPARMQFFRQHENVFVGAPDAAERFRDQWIERGLSLLSGLGLNVSAEVANDPFFGRVGKMLKANQRESELKYEIVSPIASVERPTAIASCNCHLDHLTTPFDIRLIDGARAHSACVGFGVDRCTLALVKTHGTDIGAWPGAVRARLFP